VNSNQRRRGTLRAMLPTGRWRTRLVFFVVLAVAWEMLFRLRLCHRMYFLDVERGASLMYGFADGTYPLAIAVSLRRILIGYGLSLSIGIPLGLLLGASIRAGHARLDCPGPAGFASICWLPLALLWFGLSERAILFVVVMGAVLSVSLSTADGVRNTPPLYLRAARTMGARGLRLYTGVILPAALRRSFPHEAGLVICVALADGWRAALRQPWPRPALDDGRELNDMAQVIAVMSVIITLGLLVDRAVFAPSSGACASDGDYRRQAKACTLET